MMVMLYACNNVALGRVTLYLAYAPLSFVYNVNGVEMQTRKDHQ